MTSALPMLAATHPPSSEYLASSPRDTFLARASVPRSLPRSLDLRAKQEDVILYLPPLLSRLPSQAEAPPTTEPYDFVTPTVGYTTTFLPTIDLCSWHLHIALHHFRPVSPDYAHCAYDKAFNWHEIRLPASLEREWYLICFRSQRALDTPSVDLYEADRAAHEEAVASGGLLLYWYGVPTAAGANLATCCWRSRSAALASVCGPKHQEAMSLAAEMYESFSLERWVLSKRKGTEHVSLKRWQEGEVGF